MNLLLHTSHDYAGVLAALLPPGAAWDWPAGGIGAGLLSGTSAELARLDPSCQEVLDHAINLHRPAYGSWNLAAYAHVAQVAANGGQVDVADGVRPFVAGSRVGGRLYSARSRYILRVRFDRATVDPAPLAAAINAFRQAHVAPWFQDYQGGGYAPN